MKCSNCGVEWTVPVTFTSKIDVCPFCGKSIQPEKPLLSSLDDVLVHILVNFGEEALRDGIKLQSLFADLAPQLKREKVMLRYFVECNGNDVFLNAIHEDQGEARVKIKTVMEQMENDLLVSHDAVQQVCKAFWHVLGGKTHDYFQSVNPQAESQAAAQPSPKPVPQVSPFPIQDDRLLRLIDKKIKPTEEERRQLSSRGKELLRSHGPVDTAVKMISYAAQYGDHQACILLGDCYEQGLGVKKDINTAEAYYRRAAVSGNCEAQYKLGVLYRNRRDYYPAKEWLKKAADAGYRPAIDYLRSYVF